MQSQVAEVTDLAFVRDDPGTWDTKPMALELLQAPRAFPAAGGANGSQQDSFYGLIPVLNARLNFVISSCLLFQNCSI